jgi:hypothetical protein
MECGANISSRAGPVNTKIEPKATTLSRQGTGELGNMAEQHHTAGAQTFRQVPGIKNR